MSFYSNYKSIKLLIPQQLPTQVQFGHAGALANANRETARAKNRALRDAGAPTDGQ